MSEQDGAEKQFDKQRELERFRIDSMPSSAMFYVANFVSTEEEQELLSRINSTSARWTTLSHRRLQSLPSALTAKNSLLSEPLPTWLEEPILPRLLSLRQEHEEIFTHSPHKKPNHVLINEYQPGQGIMPHEDGSAYWPAVATVSLGGPIVLDIYSKDVDGIRTSKPDYRILQEPQSLLITCGEMYTDFLHGIAEVSTDFNLNPQSIANWALLGSPENYSDGESSRSIRTSLTYRDVLKVSNLASKLKLFNR